MIKYLKGTSAKLRNRRADSNNKALKQVIIYYAEIKLNYV